jgi:hypothetical protein
LRVLSLMAAAPFMAGLCLLLAAGLMPGRSANRAAARVEAEKTA